jgi:uncharacterized protein
MTAVPGTDPRTGLRSRVWSLLRWLGLIGRASHPAEDRRTVLRRRIVVVITLVCGSVLLGISLNVQPADRAFYPLTGALAAVWIIGALVSGPLHLGRTSATHSPGRPWVQPVLLGLAIAAVFVVGALIVHQIPPLDRLVADVLEHERQGSGPLIVALTLVNGAAEEMFFRGALYASLGPHRPVLISTVVYLIATAASGNPMLMFAAVTLGVVLALQRRSSGGVLAPAITHVIWSIVMLAVLPAIFS